MRCKYCCRHAKTGVCASCLLDIDVIRVFVAFTSRIDYHISSSHQVAYVINRRISDIVGRTHPAYRDRCLRVIKELFRRDVQVL